MIFEKILITFGGFYTQVLKYKKVDYGERPEESWIPGDSIQYQVLTSCNYLIVLTLSAALDHSLVRGKLLSSKPGSEELNIPLCQIQVMVP